MQNGAFGIVHVAKLNDNSTKKINIYKNHKVVC